MGCCQRCGQRACACGSRGRRGATGATGATGGAGLGTGNFQSFSGIVAAGSAGDGAQYSDGGPPNDVGESYQYPNYFEVTLASLSVQVFDNISGAEASIIFEFLRVPTSGPEEVFYTVTFTGADSSPSIKFDANVLPLPSGDTYCLRTTLGDGGDLSGPVRFAATVART